MTAEIICVGTELLLGNIVNTNAAYISRECAGLGLSVYSQEVVGDNDKRLGEVFAEAFGRSDTVILSGGLGPTEDDLTKETVSRVLGLRLVCDPEAKVRMEKIFGRSGRRPTENNYKQALVPAGCKVLYNENGTAPGMIIEKDGHRAVLLPGPPTELVPMFEKQVRPYLAGLSDEVIYSVTVKECGIGESLLETRLLDIIDKQTNPTVATYAKTGRCEIRVTARAADTETARELVKPVVKEIKARLGSAVFTTDENEDIEHAVIRLLKKHGLKAAAAESCTGGLVCAKLVNVSGASDVFTHGFITYSNKSKRKVLGVSRDTLKKYSAVSKEVAKEMAKGCIFTADSDVSVAVTGYAGPNDSKEEPKGLVYIACSVKDKVLVEKYNFDGDRAKIRESAAVRALDLLRTSIISAYK
ncbi:MAG: competence/damage-inducible protein A [Butyrivibrio sp.]|nr:competence/damage-inducible protein A [Butyrivibrio sp.]